MSVYTDIHGNRNPALEKITGSQASQLWFLIKCGLAIYGWVKCPRDAKLILFLMFFGIPIPLLLCVNSYPVVAFLLFLVWIAVTVGGYIRMWRKQTQYNNVQRAAGQLPIQRLQRFLSGRALIAYDGNPRPPEGPTGPSPVPSAPPPAPTAPSSPWQSPMGSTTPTLWVPTYTGPARPVQRREITMGGTVIRDHRRIDPDTL